MEQLTFVIHNRVEKLLKRIKQLTLVIHNGVENLLKRLIYVTKIVSKCLFKKKQKQFEMYLNFLCSIKLTETLNVRKKLSCFRMLHQKREIKSLK